MLNQSKAVLDNSRATSMTPSASRPVRVAHGFNSCPESRARLPMRIELRSYSGTLLRMLSAPLLTGLCILWYFSKTFDDGVFDAGLPLLFFGLVVMLVVAWAAYTISRKRILWIEVGEGLRYETLTGIHELEWIEIRRIRFDHRIRELTGEEDCSGFSLESRLMIEPQGITNGCCEQLRAFRDTAVRVFADQLKDNDAETRRRAAEALARFNRDTVSGLRKTTDGLCESQKAEYEECVTKAGARAAQFDSVLAEIVPRLRDAAVDTDASVRRAARDALMRNSVAKHWEHTFAAEPIRS